VAVKLAVEPAEIDAVVGLIDIDTEELGGVTVTGVLCRIEAFATLVAIT